MIGFWCALMHPAALNSLAFFDTGFLAFLIKAGWISMEVCNNVGALI